MTQELQATVGTHGYASRRFFSSSLLASLCVQWGVVKGLGGVASTEFLPCCRVVPPLLPNRLAQPLFFSFFSSYPVSGGEAGTEF